MITVDACNDASLALVFVRNANYSVYALCSRRSFPIKLFRAGSVCENGLAFLHSQRKENTEGRAVRDGGNSNWNTSSGLAQSENRREGRAGLRSLNERAAKAEY